MKDNFEELWKEIEKFHVLSNVAIVQVPQVLSEEVKLKLTGKSPGEITKIVKRAIEEIDHGSVSSIDELIRKQIGGMKVQ